MMAGTTVRVSNENLLDLKKSRIRLLYRVMQLTIIATVGRYRPSHSRLRHDRPLHTFGLLNVLAQRHTYNSRSVLNSQLMIATSRTLSSLLTKTDTFNYFVMIFVDKLRVVL